MSDLFIKDLKKACEHRSIAHIAEVMGVNRRTMQRIKKGDRKPSPHIIETFYAKMAELRDA